MNDDTVTGNLNDQQLQAVMHTDGPLLILAGAGSGKTRALTHRIARLMSEGVKPWEILAVTFTNKAATEMKTRITNLLHITEGDDLSQWKLNAGKLPVMGTFHSICARILRKDIDKLGNWDRTFVIYDSDDQERVVKEICRERGIDDKELKPKAILGYIGRFKCEAVGPSDAMRDANTSRMQQIIDVYKQYQSALRQANALDFDDLILETVRLFHEVPEVLEKYQRTWKYLHIDEYQDTNHAQYLFISLLAGAHHNLCVIGDPDQSIYKFRGADIRNILEFEKEYPNAVRIKLEQNYRSTQPILTAADAVIAENPNRPEKTMWTEQKEGAKIIVSEVENERMEAQEAMKAAERMYGRGVRWNDQVILYRTNAQSRLFEEACLKSGIPYRIVGGLKFYARREVKDVLAYLHVILNPYDTVSLLRIINVPLRKIGQTTMGKVQAYGSANNLPLWDCLRQVDQIETLNAGVQDKIARFTELIETYQEKAKSLVVSDLVSSLIRAIDLEGYLRDDTEEGETRWQNVKELQSVTHKYDTLDSATSLTSFLEEVSLVSEVDKLQDASSDALTLMTLHLCKGLEYDHVMIAGCEEGIFPHSNAMFDREQLEEERRLMYVGMTRAKKDLRLLCARTRMLWGDHQTNAPSRFLDDLPDEVTERRSDDVLSAFAWASKKGADAVGTDVGVENTRKDIAVDFNQDINFDDLNQDINLSEGSRVQHPVFGTGTVKAIRGDVAEVEFDSGDTKHLALSVAPLTLI